MAKSKKLKSWKILKLWNPFKLELMCKKKSKETSKKNPQQKLEKTTKTKQNKNNKNQ